MDPSMASMPSSAMPLGHPPRVSQETFIAVAWAAVAIGLLSFLIRVIVRLKVFHKLFADDPLVLFSCVLLLSNTITWQMVKEDMYLNLAVSAGQLYPPPADFPGRTERYLRATVAIIAFFYTGLWAIKLSFLVFFKRLGENVRNQTTIWWSVMAVTCASYFACLGTIEYKCLAGSFMYIEFIIVPVNMLWKVKINLRQKFALGAIFSITVFIMVFAIIRVVAVSSFSQLPDQTWLYMWSSVEQTVSILVACLASFRALFTNTKPPPRQHRISDEETEVNSSASSRWILLFKKPFQNPAIFTKPSSKGSRSGGSGPIGLRSVAPLIPEIHRTSISAAKNPWQHHSEPSCGSKEHILWSNRVHVKQDIDMA